MATKYNASRLKRSLKTLVQGLCDQTDLTMRESAELVKNTAREMAPVDYGDLEEAIKIKNIQGRDKLGRWSNNISYDIYVDGSMICEDPRDQPGRDNRKHPKKVGEYAGLVHEQVTPAGPMQLGPESKKKNQRNGGLVGGGYMVRALDLLRDTVKQELANDIEHVVSVYDKTAHMDKISKKRKRKE